MPPMTRVTRPASPATELDRFRRLIVAALLTGAAAGLLLFVVQHLTLVPLIEIAEGFEDAAALAHAAAGHVHVDEGWQPAPGLQRVGLTAIASMLSGIGFASVLMAAMTIGGASPGVRRGLVWGLAGFACFVLAPAMGLPPKPPGAAVGDLHARQLWWLGTVVATAAGLWLIARPGWGRLVGVGLLALPHVIGAPVADGADEVPRALMVRFAWLSVAANLLFWLALGTLSGWFLSRAPRVVPSARD